MFPLYSGWWLSPTPLKNMTSSVGMIMIDYSQYMESHKIPWFQTTNQISIGIHSIPKSSHIPIFGETLENFTVQVTSCASTWCLLCTEGMYSPGHIPGWTGRPAIYSLLNVCKKKKQSVVQNFRTLKIHQTFQKTRCLADGNPQCLLVFDTILVAVSCIVPWFHGSKCTSDCEKRHMLCKE